jgi:hypothetical protein
LRTTGVPAARYDFAAATASAALGAKVAGVIETP